MKKVFKDSKKNSAILSSRVICEANKGYLTFWYSEDKSTNNRVRLFDTDNYSGSVRQLFRTKGRPEKTRGYSMKISQLYELPRTENPKINQVMRNIPITLREELNKRERFCMTVARSKKTPTSKNILDLEHDYYIGRTA